jgi:protein-tyrosine phosphatase
VTRICFVCLGNICRSPMAEVVLTAMLREAGLGDRVAVSSAGTGDWHVGQPADERAAAAIRARGLDLETHRARQFGPADFDDQDLVIALDRHNLADLRGMAPAGQAGKVALLMAFAGEPDADVPDPYYGGAQDYDLALELIQRGCDGLLRHLTETGSV